ncbi:MAG TPA: hypothetical protein VGN88_13890 [Phycisphaerae bacterium]|jgi:hypothetical protein
MDKYIILLPMNYNDGTKVSREVLKRVIAELYDLANGYTIEGKIRGAYRMKSGQKQEDDHLKIWVLISPEDAEPLRELVRKFCRELGQESMWLEKTMSIVEFVEGDLPDGEKL